MAPLSADEADVLARYLNLGVASATAEYVRSSEERLKARQSDLEFLCAGMSVLVVDDEEDARDLLRIVLESCEVTVHDAANARHALNTFRKSEWI